MAKANNVVPVVSALDLITLSKGAETKSVTEIAGNWMSVKAAKIVGTGSAVTANFGQHKKLAYEDAKSAADVNLAREANVVAARINARNQEMARLLGL